MRIGDAANTYFLYRVRMFLFFLCKCPIIVIIWNYKEGDWMFVGIGSVLYATFVFCFFALFVFSLFSFIRFILRNNNQKASSLHEMKRLQKEQNELLKELIHSIKEKNK